MTPDMSAPCGILCVDKSAGMTSHDVVGRVRRLFGLRRTGHAGTLDPMATGVLTVLVGRATAAAEYLSAADKEYFAGLKLGIVTDTLDTTGRVLQTATGALPSRCEVEAAAACFVGELEQIPPMYSAIKSGGRKLYELAREGKEVERAARRITIYSLETGCVDEEAGDYTLSVRCSKGTYIRSLCADIGEKLGCGGAMSSLRRTRAGVFRIEEAHTLDELDAMSGEELGRTLLPVELVFEDAPVLRLSDFYARLARNGQSLYASKLGVSFAEGELLRLCDRNGFFAAGRAVITDGELRIKPEKLFS